MERKPRLSLVVAIVERGKGDAVSAYFSDRAFGFVAMLGRGTAKQHWLNVLGIGDINKDLVAFLLNGDLVPSVQRALEEKFRIGKGGGVAFTLRVQSIADKRVLSCFAEESEV